VKELEAEVAWRLTRRHLRLLLSRPTTAHKEGATNHVAAQTLVLFLTSVLIAVLLVAPQPPAALGWELLAVAAVSGVALVILDRRAGHGSDRGVARYIERFSPNAITAVLVGVAGLTFPLKAGGGLYWLIPAAVASLLGGVVNAWLFLVKAAS